MSVTNILDEDIQAAEFLPEWFETKSKIIMARVCKEYGITMKQIRQRTKKKKIVIPRRVSMYLMSTVMKSNLMSIAQAHGFTDHVNTMNALKAIEKAMIASETFSELVEGLTDEVRELIK